MNMSADNQGTNLAHGGQLGQASSHSKHISMTGLPYDKMKGLTPVSNKSGGPAAKNNLHLQNQLAQFNDDEKAGNPGGGRSQPANGRGNHSRMPSLP